VYPMFFDACKGESGVCMQEVAREMKLSAAMLSAEIPVMALLIVAAASNLKVSGKVNINSMLMPFYVDGAPCFFALATFFILVDIAAVLFLVMAVRLGFWVEKKPFLALLAMVIVGASVATAYWMLVSMGHQDIGHSAEVPNVSLVTVNILGRVTNVAFLLVFALFTWMVIVAVVETFFHEQRKLNVNLALVCLVVVALGTVVYSIAMIVIQSFLQQSLTIDASGPLLAGVSFLFSAVLTVMWLVVWRLVETKKANEPGFAKMRRQVILFLAGSTALSCCFLVFFVVATLELTVDYFKYEEAARGLNIASVVLSVLAILGYVAMSVISASRGRWSKNSNKEVLLNDNDGVPVQYAMY